ncbi:hypothetical protein NAC44_08605 [Allorhizobium sp. BGMRC 0089]|nr:hypothetical protein [Allorhizobium sonneratiae]
MPKTAPFLCEELGEGPRPFRLAIVAEDDATFRTRIHQAIAWLERNPERQRRQQNGLWYSPSPIDNPRIAVMFPGHGAQYPAMLCAHERHIPVVRSWFYELSQIYGQGIHPCPLRHLPIKGETDAERQHLQSIYALEGGGVHGMIGSVALYHALRLAGIEADILCGYSNGENAAMIASGVAAYRSITDLFERIAGIATAGQGGLSRGEIPLGATLSVTFAEPDRLHDALANIALDLDLVASNSPFNFVLYGAFDAIQAARPLLEAKGAIVLPLPNDRSYHTPHFAPELPSMREVLDQIPFQKGRLPVFSCSALTTLPGDNPKALRSMATQQYVTPVRFRESIDLLSDKGINLFIDVGPRGQLAAMARETLPSGSAMVVECDRRDQDGWYVMMAALAQLHVAGFSPKPENWFQPANVALKGDRLLSSLTADVSPTYGCRTETVKSFSCIL